ncbi:hypothetical protein B0H10DRAFT_2073213 [Mycena sp. CBHHK59/15]|nr:hypothetical protein B0H10DRAFT_2073213 [Mycena sp. CBHHK59/15]
MSDDSYLPSSSPLKPTWHMSQQHYYEYKQEHIRRRNIRRKEKENKRAKKIKQEPSSPCITPRASTARANNLFKRQFADALNSQMGENTCIEKWINERGSPSPGPRASTSNSASQDFDDMDIDLLRVHCAEAESQRDNLLQEVYWIEQELRRMEDERDEALKERDQAMAKCDAWEEASMGASALIRMASECL